MITIKTHINKIVPALALVATGVAANAQVAGEDVISDLSSQVTALSAAGFTVLAAVIAAAIGMKLVKKFSGKAT